MDHKPTSLTIQLSPQMLQALEAWATEQDPPPQTPDAVIAIVADALMATGHLPLEWEAPEE